MKQTHEEIHAVEGQIKKLQADKAMASGADRVNLASQIQDHKKTVKDLKNKLGVTSSKKHSGFA